MDDERKKELFPYFAYMYSQQMDPDTYGSVNSIEDWTNLIQNNEEDMNKITSAAEALSDDDWDNLDKQYTEQTEEEEKQATIFAAKGAKLKKLRQSAKKCACGCKTVMVKEGGRMVEKCPCEDKKIGKKENGGTIMNSTVKEILESFKKGGNLEQKKEAKKKVPDRIKKAKLLARGKMKEEEKLQAGGKAKNKFVKVDDEEGIPDKAHGGVDMNPNSWKPGVPNYATPKSKKPIIKKNKLNNVKGKWAQKMDEKKEIKK